MFNFFNEIKKNLTDLTGGYNLINISNKKLYVEGHKGLCLISKTNIVFKVNGGRIVVEGEDFILNELSQNTFKLEGNIFKTEAY